MAQNDGAPRRLLFTEMLMGAIAIFGLALFVVGLVVSIGSVPFGIIVTVVLTMALVDYYQSIWSNGD